MESGGLNQWTGFTATGNAREQITQAVTHSGNYALALHANASQGEAGIRARYEERIFASDPHNLPPDGYYSVWINIPQPLNPVNNIFQWKQAQLHCLSSHTGKNDCESQTRLLLYFVRADWIASDGNHQLVLRGKIDPNNGSWPNPGGTYALANSGGLRLELNRWHHLECRYLWDQTRKGRIQCWLDGHLWADLSNLYTQVPLTQSASQPNPGAPTYKTKPRQWTVNNYMTSGNGAWDPVQTVIYFDDAIIGTSRVGP
jgi:hypothetical protein